MAEEASVRRILILTIIVVVVLLILVLVFTLLYRASSNTSASATGCASLPPPTGLDVFSSGLSNIQVAWNPVINAARYHVYIGSISGFDKSTAFNDFLTGDTEYTITGMVLGRTYYIKVATVNGCSGEGLLSAEQSVSLGYPPRFRIVSRDEPTLALRVAPDFENVIVDSFCSGVPGDDLCIWSYDSDNSFMTTANTPTNCMKTFPATVDARIKYEPCSNFLYYNWVAARQWNYDTSNGSLCNPQNPEGINCVKISGPATPGQTTVNAPYDGFVNMQWDIVQA